MMKVDFATHATVHCNILQPSAITDDDYSNLMNHLTIQVEQLEAAYLSILDAAPAIDKQMTFILENFNSLVAMHKCSGVSSQAITALSGICTQLLLQLTPDVPTTVVRSDGTDLQQSSSDACHVS